MVWGLVACADDAKIVSQPPAAGAAGSAGAAGTAGTAGTAGAAGSSGSAGDSGVTVNADAVALEACAAPEVCAEGGVQKIDNTSYNLREPATDCVLSALAQRRPGRYHYRTDNRHAGGGVEVSHLILITADGSVQYVRTVQEDNFQTGFSVRPEAALRCTPKPASYFDACREAIESRPAPSTGQFAEPFWTCVFGGADPSTVNHLEWFESCVEESPGACDADGYHGPADGDAGADGGADAGQTDAG